MFDLGSVVDLEHNFVRWDEPLFQFLTGTWPSPSYMYALLHYRVNSSQGKPGKSGKNLENLKNQGNF